jgi:hypothetical protein
MHPFRGDAVHQIENKGLNPDSDAFSLAARAKVTANPPRGCLTELTGVIHLLLLLGASAK